MTTAAILDALEHPMTRSELSSAIGCDSRKLSAMLQALRKQGRTTVRRIPGFPGARCEWIKIPLASEVAGT